MSAQQFTRLSLSDYHADDSVSGYIDHVSDERYSRPVSVMVIAGLSGALWGIAWYVGRGIIGM